jgi:hypothetical protein
MSKLNIVIAGVGVIGRQHLENVKMIEMVQNALQFI